MFGSATAEILNLNEQSGDEESSDNLAYYLEQSTFFEKIKRITYLRYRLKNTNLWIDYFERGNSYKFGVDFNPAPQINNVQIFNTKNIKFSDFIQYCPKQVAVDLLFYIHEFSE